MGKISQKYIGSNQVGSEQIELENDSAIRAKSADGLSSVELMELDPSNLLQILLHPYLPGDATSPLQSIPKQQLDSAVSAIDGQISGLDSRLTTAEGEIDTLQAEMSTAQADIIALDGRVGVLESEMDTAEANIIALDGRVGTLEGQVSALQSDKVEKSGDIMTGTLTLPLLSVYNTTLATGMFVGNGDAGYRGEGNNFIDVSNSLFINSDNAGNIEFDSGFAHVKVKTAPSESDDVIRKQELDAAQASLEAEDLTFLKLDGSRAMQGDLSMMPEVDVHYKITGLADPTEPRDAVNKQYVDAFAEGLHVHAPAKVIINEPLADASGGTVSYDNGADGVGATLTLSVALTSYDTYVFQEGDRVIINGEANLAHNGIYTVGSNGALGSVFTRALDYNTPLEMAGGDFVFIQEGDQYADTGWVQVDVVSVVGTDPVMFVQFSGAGTYTAGDALTLVGTEFSVVYDNSTISLDGSNQLRVDPLVMDRISTLESEMDTAQADIISLDGRVGTLEGQVSALQSDKVEKSGDIMTGTLTLPLLSVYNSVLGTGMFVGNGDAGYRGEGNNFIDVSNSLFINSDNAGNIEFDSGFAHVKVKTAPSESDDVIRKQELDALQSALEAEDLTFLKLDGSRSMTASLDMAGFSINNIADPTQPQDAASKAYVDAQIAAGTDFHKQAITLSAQNIIDQYVDLSVQAIAQSCSVFVGERVALFEGLDYTVSIEGGVTRLTFAGPSATGGAEELAEGQTLYIQCVIE